MSFLFDRIILILQLVSFQRLAWCTRRLSPMSMTPLETPQITATPRQRRMFTTPLETPRGNLKSRAGNKRI